MKTRSLALVAAAGLALAACGDMMTGESEMDPITRALSGSTLTQEGTDNLVNFNADGTFDGVIAGSELLGNWAIQDGQYCRTVIAPEAHAGSGCQDVELGDDEITFINPDGSPGARWQIM